MKDKKDFMIHPTHPTDDFVNGFCHQCGLPAAELDKPCATATSVIRIERRELVKKLRRLRLAHGH
jgi:hypothetical protein